MFPEFLDPVNEKPQGETLRRFCGEVLTTRSSRGQYRFFHLPFCLFLLFILFYLFVCLFFLRGFSRFLFGCLLTVLAFAHDFYSLSFRCYACATFHYTTWVRFFLRKRLHQLIFR